MSTSSPTSLPTSFPTSAPTEEVVVSSYVTTIIFLTTLLGTYVLVIAYFMIGNYTYFDDLRQKIRKAHEDRIARGSASFDDDDHARMDEEDNGRKVLQDDVLQRALFEDNNHNKVKSKKKTQQDEDEDEENGEYNTFSETDKLLMILRAEAGIFEPFDGDHEDEAIGKKKISKKNKSQSKSEREKIPAIDDCNDEVDEVRSQMSTDDLL
jgi:hypothetical protein